MRSFPLIALIPALLASQAHAIEPFKAQGIEPYKAQTIEPVKAQAIEPYKAKTIEPVKAQPIPPVRAQPIVQGQPPASKPASPPAKVDPSFFLRTFGLAIPGVAYTVDNYATNTRTLVTSTGAVTKSAVRINRDHTYAWNSAWDGKLIRGKWVEDAEGILLLNAQGGRTWMVRRLSPAQGKAEITVWDQNAIWYNGTPIAAK